MDLFFVSVCCSYLAFFYVRFDVDAVTLVNKGLALEKASETIKDALRSPS